MSSVPPRRLRGLVALAIATAALLGLVVLSWLRHEEERRAIAGLPDGDRKALFERTRRALETTCSRYSEALGGYCEQQADLILRFPECDGACVELARKRSPRPTR